jgi:restriction endonuclease S subunit
LSSLSFPLPPLTEQQEIAEKVDQVIAIVDALEKQVAERKDQAEMLMQTVLREAFAGLQIILGLVPISSTW